MTDVERRRLAERMAVVLPRFGHWANGFREVSTPHGRVGYRQFSVLWLLRFELLPREELTPTRLADYFDVQPSVMTRCLAKLEAAGLIDRRGDPVDRRRVHISITQSGREVSDYVQSVFTRDMMASMAFLDDMRVGELGRNIETLDTIASDLEQRRYPDMTQA